MNLERATRGMLPEIVAIYNSTVASRQVTADLSEVSVAERESWFNAHQRDNRPLWVARDGSGSVLAWGSFSDYYPRDAYNRTVEISVYLRSDQRGKGLGKRIVTEMLRRASDLGIAKVIAVIFAHNTPSVRLFQKLGFSEWGKLPEVCDLDGQLADIVLLGKTIE